MLPLPRRLKRARTWLLLLGVVIVLAVADSFRAPEEQLTARTYIGAVHVYQYLGRPVLQGCIVCRFTPSCSDYSIEAVRRYGIRRGLALTFNRLSRCNCDTPMGMDDPVPADEE